MDADLCSWGEILRLGSARSGFRLRAIAPLTPAKRLNFDSVARLFGATPLRMTALTWLPQIIRQLFSHHLLLVAACEFLHGKLSARDFVFTDDDDVLCARFFRGFERLLQAEAL